MFRIYERTMLLFWAKNLIESYFLAQPIIQLLFGFMKFRKQNTIRVKNKTQFRKHVDNEQSVAWDLNNGIGNNLKLDAEVTLVNFRDVPNGCRKVDLMEKFNTTSKYIIEGH